MLPSEYIQKGWCKESLARTIEGKYVHYDNPKAVAWCVAGAVAVACHSSINRVQAISIVQYIQGSVGGSIVDWNNTQESAEPIIAMLQAAEKVVLCER